LIEISDKDLLRFISKVKFFAPGECWEWGASCTSNGYGQFRISPGNDGMYLAHRFSFEITKGTIPNGMHICHSCDNRKCINPDHLWLGTQSDNQKEASIKKRFFNQRKDACPNGHKYDEQNTRITKGNWRSCRKCDMLRMRKKREEESPSQHALSLKRKRLSYHKNKTKCLT